MHSTLSFGAPDPMDNPLKKSNLVTTPKSSVSPKKSVRFIDDTDLQDRREGNLTTTNSGVSTLSDGSSKAATEVTYVGEDGNLDALLARGEDAGPKILSQDSFDCADEKLSPQKRPDRKSSLLRMSSTEAIQIGMMLAEQEKKYGTNMYESLQKADEPKVAEFVKKGYTTEEAILMVFEDKFVNSVSKIPVSPRNATSLQADTKVSIY